MDDHLYIICLFSSFGVGQDCKSTSNGWFPTQTTTDLFFCWVSIVDPQPFGMVWSCWTSGLACCASKNQLGTQWIWGHQRKGWCTTTGGDADGLLAPLYNWDVMVRYTHFLNFIKRNRTSMRDVGRTNGEWRCGTKNRKMYVECDQIGDQQDIFSADFGIQRPQVGTPRDHGSSCCRIWRFFLCGHLAVA